MLLSKRKRLKQKTKDSFSTKDQKRNEQKLLPSANRENKYPSRTGCVWICEHTVSRRTLSFNSCTEARPHWHKDVQNPSLWSQVAAAKDWITIETQLKKALIETRQRQAWDREQREKQVKCETKSFICKKS